MRREFLQLAKTYNPQKHNVAGWFISEKLDGTRCFWDGGLSRNVPTDKVPFASVTNPKTGERKAKIKPVATGLWSRYGNPIMAPDWFLDELPNCPLDGELWAGRGNFQLCRSICGGDAPDPRFDQIKYAVYSMPPGMRVFGGGEIKNTNFHCVIDTKKIANFIVDRMAAGCAFQSLPGDATFEDEFQQLKYLLEGRGHVFAHKQICLPENEEPAKEFIEGHLEGILLQGGEGVVIRNPQAVWTPKRVNALLKYKPFSDAEATITGFTSGRKTNKGSKHLGKIGALITDFNGKRLELSGLTDKEREFLNPTDTSYAKGHPGEDMPTLAQGKYFKVGQAVTFIYRELSDDGIPKEARYFRKRGVE